MVSSGAARVGAGAAQHGPHAGHELAETERLDDVVVGPELEQQDPVDLVAPSAHDDDRHVRSGRAASGTTTRPSRSGRPRSNSTRSAGSAASAASPWRRGVRRSPRASIRRREARRSFRRPRRPGSAWTQLGARGRPTRPIFAVSWQSDCMAACTAVPTLGDRRSERTRRSPMKRTALVTAASIAAVVITGTAAVGANIGILSSADDSPVGDLGATTEVARTPSTSSSRCPRPSPRRVPSRRPAEPATPCGRSRIRRDSEVRTEVVPGRPGRDRRRDRRRAHGAGRVGRTGRRLVVDPRRRRPRRQPRRPTPVGLGGAGAPCRGPIRRDARRPDRPSAAARGRQPTDGSAGHADDDRYDDDDHDDDRYEDDDHDDDRYEDDDRRRRPRRGPDESTTTGTRTNTRAATMTTEPEPTAELDAERPRSDRPAAGPPQPDHRGIARSGVPRRRRRHPARDSRIAATAIGCLGLVRTGDRLRGRRRQTAAPSSPSSPPPPLRRSSPS